MINITNNNNLFKNLLLLISNMSGQPNRYANSAEMFRNQYMDALNSRANVDDFNLQANKNFKATGSLPPSVSKQVDNRTTTEILADTEKLKLNIISELKPVMNSGTASVVVQKIQTAPINADGSFLVWIAQNIPEIVKSLKKKYAIGIKGDAQDATNIVIFLTDMYSKIKDYTGTVKTYFDTVGDSKTGLKEGDLDALRKEYEVIVARLKTKVPNYREPNEKKINDLVMSTTEKISGLFVLITSENYKRIISDLLGINGALELTAVNGVNDVSKLAFEFLDSLPSVPIVRTMYKQLEKSLENKNTNLSVNILQKIYDLFPDISKIVEIQNALVFIRPDFRPNGKLEISPDLSGVFPKNLSDYNDTFINVQDAKLSGRYQNLETLLKGNFVMAAYEKAVRDTENQFIQGLTNAERRSLLKDIQVEEENFRSQVSKILNEIEKLKNQKYDMDVRSKQYSDILFQIENKYNELGLIQDDYRSFIKDVDDQTNILEYADKGLENFFKYANKVSQTNRDLNSIFRTDTGDIQTVNDLVDLNPTISTPKRLPLGKKTLDELTSQPQQPQQPQQSQQQISNTVQSMMEQMKQYNDDKRAIEKELNTVSLTIKEESDLRNDLDELKKEMKRLSKQINDAGGYNFSSITSPPLPPKKDISINLNQSYEDELLRIERELQDTDYEVSQLGARPVNNPVAQRLYDEEANRIDMRIYRLEQKAKQIKQLMFKPTGSGLKKRRGRPKGSGIAFKDNIDHAKGIQPAKKYHPFGKYFVNSHKLNHGNVLSIRSKSGTNVREYPSRTVSPHMASIVKTIIGGGVPSWNDMSKLTEDEKDYLYKVSKRAEFADKISIPTPSKDKLEKDIHEFEVCKGEIMAGNDSKELIKKFKLLIIKLSKNGTIPKREATEVMQELLELGY